MSDAISVIVTRVKGSAPRGVGTVMRVFADRIEGSIGGGALEWEAMRIARSMAAASTPDTERSFPLGPDLGQCCGGSVTLRFTREGGLDAPKNAAPLWIWGAGHVGRALAQIMAPLADRDITLIDISADRLPTPLPDGVSPLVATDPLRVVQRSPNTADHVIVTYSHDLDLNLCDALLRRETGSIGLIGSTTKWARFRSRLGAMGHKAEAIDQITCPIGDPSLGKHPQAIAIGVAGRLISAAAQGAPKEGIA